MENSYQSPESDAEPAREKPKAEQGGCGLAIVSFLVFWTANDAVVASALPHFASDGAVWARGLAFAPIGCLIGWLLVFYGPLPTTGRFAALGSFRGIRPAARHGLLWAAMALIVILVFLVIPH